MRRTGILAGVGVLAAGLAAWWFLGGGAPDPAAQGRAGRAAPPPPPASTPDPPVDPLPGPPPDAPAASTPVRPPGDAIAVTGRVVDDRRNPVSGAAVVATVPGSPALTGATGDAGRFRIPGLPRREGWWERAGLLARASDGRAGTATADLSGRGGSESDAGTIVLEAAGPLAVHVTEGGSGVPGARVLLVRQFSVVTEGVTGSDGTARFPAVPAGAWIVQAAADGPVRCGRAEGMVVAREETAIEVALAPARTVEVLVREKGTGKPVEGATLALWRTVRVPEGTMNGPAVGLPSVAPTDAEGRTRIEGTLPDELLRVHDLRAPGYPASAMHRQWSVKPGETEVLLEIEPGRTVRFPIVAGEVPVPPDGTVVELLPSPGSAMPEAAGAGRMDGASLVVEAVPPSSWQAHARAPDGSLARIFVRQGEDTGMETSFRRPRSVEVIARRAGGTPAAGVSYAVRNQGNNLLAGPAATDADGAVMFRDLFGGLVEVYDVPDPAVPHGGRAVGSLDLEKGDGRIETTVGDPRAVLVRVTVDGEPRLPGAFGLSVQGIPVKSPAEDPSRGELRCEVPVDAAAASLIVQMSALPLLPATARVEPVPAEGTIEIDLPLVSGGAFHVRLVLPGDNGARPELRRLGEDGTTWGRAFVPGVMMDMRPGPDGLVRFAPLEPGTYRVTDTATGVSTPPVAVEAGGSPAVASLDLSASGWVSGRVESPEGTDIKAIRVRVEAPGLDTAPAFGSFGPEGARILPDGTFRIRVPGDRSVTLLPWHPVLSPSPEGGTAPITGPRDGVVLRLAPGRSAVARLEPAPKPSPAPMGGRNRVLLYRGVPEGPPTAERDAVLDGDRLAFGGYEPGTWTLWIDLQQGAPVVLRDVSLGEGETDLGVLRLEEGGSLRVRVLVKEGQDPPRIGVFAWRLDDPKYSRGMNSRGEAEPVLTGLGPGRFRVNVMPVMGSGARTPIVEIVDHDGVSERVLTLDLR